MWQFNEAFLQKSQPQRPKSFPCSRINELTRFTFHQLLCNFWVHADLSREFPLPLHSVPNSHSPMRTTMTKTKPQFNEAWLQNQIHIRPQKGHEWPNQVTIQRTAHFTKTSTHNASKRDAPAGWGWRRRPDPHWTCRTCPLQATQLAGHIPAVAAAAAAATSWWCWVHRPGSLLQLRSEGQPTQLQLRERRPWWPLLAAGARGEQGRQANKQTAAEEEPNEGGEGEDDGLGIWRARMSGAQFSSCVSAYHHSCFMFMAYYGQVRCLKRTFFPFFLCAHFLWDMAHPIHARWLANPSCAHCHFPHDLRRLYEYLIVDYQSEGFWGY